MLANSVSWLSNISHFKKTAEILESDWLVKKSAFWFDDVFFQVSIFRYFAYSCITFSSVITGYNYNARYTKRYSAHTWIPPKPTLISQEKQSHFYSNRKKEVHTNYETIAKLRSVKYFHCIGVVKIFCFWILYSVRACSMYENSAPFVVFVFRCN